jgi:hypothetical protein
MYRRIVRQTFTDVSDESTASVLEKKQNVEAGSDAGLKRSKTNSS